MKSGLVSVTFRSLTVDQIIDLAAKAKLQAIEWGGDVHVPPGDPKRARAVGEQTRQAGLEVACYGSYYRLCKSKADGLNFGSVLETALALEADCIRIWAGTVGSQEADADYRRRAVDESLEIGAATAAVGLTVAYEFHGNTLTDTLNSAIDLLDQTAAADLRSLWQPMNGQPLQTNLKAIEALAARIHHAHVFHWWPTAAQRHALADGEEHWKCYLGALNKTPCRYALLEFVKGDDPQQLLADADTLNRWLASSST